MGTSMCILIPHHLIPYSSLIFWSLSISINTMTFLPIFKVIFLIFWFILEDAIFSLYWPLIWFRAPFPLLLPCKFHLNIVGPSHKLSSTKNLQSIIIETFNNSELIRYSNTNATGLAQQYDSFLHTLTNIHALLATKNLSPKPSNPWMTPAILASKQHIENVWRQNATALNRSILTRQKILCNRQMSKAKLAHYSKLLLSTLTIMGHYGRNSTKSCTIALKCTFLIIPLLLL